MFWKHLTKRSCDLYEVGVISLLRICIEASSDDIAASNKLKVTICCWLNLSSRWKISKSVSIPTSYVYCWSVISLFNTNLISLIQFRWFHVTNSIFIEVRMQFRRKWWRGILISQLLAFRRCSKTVFARAELNHYMLLWILFVL